MISTQRFYVENRSLSSGNQVTGLCGDVRSDVDVANAIASVQEL